MPFQWVYVCDLLETLEKVSTHDPPYMISDLNDRQKQAVVTWFRNHRGGIDTASGLGLLSCLLPGSRPDRVYDLQQVRLERVIARIFGLSKGRRHDLGRWRQPGAGDLADCVERVARQAELPLQTEFNKVTIEEIDEALSDIAGWSRRSAPEIRSLVMKASTNDPTTILSHVYLRLQSRESKWFTRLILKNYTPIDLPESIIFRSYHHLLPELLRFQCQLPAAFSTLKSLQDTTINDSRSISGSSFDEKHLRPQVGVKIGRQVFSKARSIKACIDMAQNRRMSVERKYDGEYCQIHIDLTKSSDKWIKIFSKNGRNSTEDRRNLHSSIRSSLRLDEPDCAISTNCILEGEMVLFGDKEQKILDFHRIRKHVSHGGYSTCIDMDSQPHPYEHLMIVFFDIMLLNGVPILQREQRHRRKSLENLVHCIAGHSDVAQHEVIDFSRSTAPKELKKVLAACITCHGEGLIMKACNDPYFDIERHGRYRSCCIKVKKDYFGNFGDVGDFAVVGAAYDAQKAKSICIPNLSWTDFYIACLENKQEVLESHTTPRYRVITTVTPPRSILKTMFRGVDTSSELYKRENTTLNIENGVARGKKPSIVFKHPLVFDIRCFSFDKELGTTFWSPRFPQVTKLHRDRTFMDTITFQDLQNMAEEAILAPEEQNSQNDLKWIERLEAGDALSREENTTSTQSSPNISPCSSSSLIQKCYPPPCEDPYISTITLTTHKSRPYLGKQIVLPTIKTITSSRSKSKSHGQLKCDATMLAATCLSPTSAVQPQSSALRNERAGMVKRTSPDGPCLTDRKISKRSSTWRASSQCLALMENLHVSMSRPTTTAFCSQSQLQSRHTFKLGAILESEMYASNENHHTTVTDAYISETNISPLYKIRSAMIESPATPVISNMSRSVTEWISATTGIQGQSRENLAVVPQSCILSHCTLALSSCVSTTKVPSANIRSFHGSIVVQHPRQWLDSLEFPCYSRTSGRKIRKLVMVERSRKQQMMEFLEVVRKLNLKGPTGKRDWVEIYDVQLFQAIAKLEKGESIPQAVWRRYWVGAV